MSGYQIADEPAPGPLARFAVNPVFPFLSMMLGGLWIAWPWFVFNGYAIGSPTLRKEVTWLALGLAVVAAVTAVLLMLVRNGALTGVAVQYAALAIPVAKLSMIYAVFVLQSRTIEIYEYYGGVLQNGVIVIVLLLFLRPSRLLDELPVFVGLVLS